jgi:hypothetical protein
MLQSPTLPRILLNLGAALLASTLTLYASAGQAAPTGTMINAELAQPAKERIIIVRGTAFTCEGTACIAAANGSSARTICAQLARKAGPVTRFSFKGEAFDAAAMERCNG